MLEETMKNKVVLIRGKLNPLVFLHDNEAGAKRRAIALAELHLVEINETEDSFIIDASDFYGREKNG